MRPSTPSAWKQRRFEAVRRAEVAALTLGLVRAPVPLRFLAHSCGIKEIIFRPLIIDGGIASDSDGSFLVYIKCAKEHVAQWRDAFYNDRDGGISLPPRVRFTIAHEIAHTFF